MRRTLAVALPLLAACARPSASRSAGATFPPGSSVDRVRAEPAARGPRTRAERTGYAETTRHAEAVAFLDSLHAMAPAVVSLGELGRSPGGRVLPYAIAARPGVATPEHARRSGRTVVYVQANIHAGEVEGKEALLALLRDLALDPKPNVLDSLVLVAVPVYNADGNEKFAAQAVNRTEQNGPEQVGERPNGQGLDLNRDYVKAEAPETRASLSMFARLDPDFFVDLHTTDGSYHGYALTYSPSLSPAAALGPWTRDSLLPELRRRVRDRRGFETYDYGNFDSVYEERDVADTLKRGWYTYDHRPRFGTNYYGVRGGVSVLSEAFSHDPLERRVRSTYAFVRELLSLAAERGGEVRRLRAAAAPRDVAVRGVLTASPFRGPVLVERLVRTGDSARTEPGVPRGVRRTGQVRPQVMAVYDRFDPALTVAVPAAYLLDASQAAAVELLRRHGLRVDVASRASAVDADVFVIDSVARAERPFQGHREVSLAGHAARRRYDVRPGTFIVRTDGPLGRLAAYLLEPRSDDGLATWGVFDAALGAGRDFPVARALVAP